MIILRATIADDSRPDGWSEKFTVEGVGHMTQEQAQAHVSTIVEKFNRTRRDPREEARRLLRVEVLSAPPCSVVEEGYDAYFVCDADEGEPPNLYLPENPNHKLWRRGWDCAERDGDLEDILKEYENTEGTDE